MNEMIKPLRPTLWRTCRVIACESRLKLLWALFAEKELCVDASAKYIGMGAAQASIQLRALNARGLIRSRREKIRVFYRPEANEAVDDSPELLAGLRWCYEREMTPKSVIRQATAFTHPRRIELVRRLAGAPLDWDELAEKAGMSDSSLYLHLRKLIRRGYVLKKGSLYELSHPRNHFGALLLQIALHGSCRSC